MNDGDLMDDTTDDRPTAQWTPVDDGADAPTQVVRFPAPRPRPMPDEQAGVPAVQSSDEPETHVRPIGAPTTSYQPTPPVIVGETGPYRPEVTPVETAPEAGTNFDALPEPQAAAGDVFAGRYRLEQQLAERGGTLTWRAFDQKLSRSVLVHLLDHDDPRTGDVLEAARKAAFATDSRFLRVLDAVAGETPGAPSLVVCEFAPGESLERLLQQGPLSALEAAWVARELADALGAMHAEGLFHQRINPDTVIITATGNVKIVGFLIEAAMYPDAEEGTLAWSERETADVQALGKVLYASLVTRWPTPREQMLDEAGNPRMTWGMPAAPMDGRGWLTPRQIRSGVSPALDVICDQVLSEAPRHNETPLRTANQVMLALNKVLGTADAAADLERRMRYPVVLVATEQTIRPGIVRTGAESLESTETMAAVRPEVQPSPKPSPKAAHTAPAAETRVLPGSRPQPRRWLTILVILVALALIGGTVRLLTRGSGSASTGTQGSQVLAIKGIDDFDPTTDGGNGEENPAQVKLATDGSPTTAWQTVTYLNDPALGKLKPGVGIVLDLGSVQHVGTVKVTLQGEPTAVELRVPAAASPDSAPMGSAKQWSVVANNAAAGTNVVLTPSGDVSSRFVLVYLTKLPKVDGNKYRGGIAEVEVSS